MPQWELLAAAGLARAGQTDNARKRVAQALARPANADLPFYHAVALTALGDDAQAVELLNRYAARAPELREFVARHVLFKRLRGQPGFPAPRSP